MDDWGKKSKEELLFLAFQLAKENTQLKEVLAKNGLSVPNQNSREDWLLADFDNTVENKIALFKEYFVIRDDIYAEYWEKDGKSGYNKACLHRWTKGICEKVGYKCRNCHDFSPAPLKDEIILKHFQGKITLGGYPILKDNYVTFFIYELSEDSYLDDLKKLLSILSFYGVDSLIEKPSNKKGVWLWVFFEEKTKLEKARLIANFFLTEAMDKFGGLSLECFDCVYPFKERIKSDVYGPLIPLPLSGKFYKEGQTTAFLDENSQLIPHPFKRLQAQQKISKSRMRLLLEKASQMPEYGLFGEEAKKMSLTRDDFKEKVHLVNNGEIIIPRLDLTSRSERFLIRLSSLLNKQFFKKRNMGVSLYNEPRILTMSVIDEETISLPRGYKGEIIATLKRLNVPYTLQETMNKGRKIEVNFNGALRADQEIVLNHLLKKEGAILHAPTGFGKTIVAVKLICVKKVNTLILVDRITLCKQWLNSLEKFIDVHYETNKKYRFGEIHGTTQKITGKIDVCLLQTLGRNQNLSYLTKDYGLVIIDECHHLSANSYLEVVRKINAKNIYGLTATPKRSDQREQLYYQTIGEIITAFENQDNNIVSKKYYPRFSKFIPSQKEELIIDLYDEVIKDGERNRLIVEDIKKQVDEGGKILILSERIEHIEKLYAMFNFYTPNVILIHGGKSKEEKESFKEKLASFKDEPFVIFSIGKYIGEGFDDSRLDTLFITFPFRWEGTLSQYVGRLNRKTATIKHVTVFDYVDIKVNAFANMAHAREKGYAKLGFILAQKDQAYTDSIYDFDHYYEAYLNDVFNAKKNIKLFIKYHHENKLKTILEACRVPVSLVIDSENNIPTASNDFIKAQVEDNLTVIDDRIIYYGGINPFVYGRSDQTIMRLEDPNLAKELIALFH